MKGDGVHVVECSKLISALLFGHKYGTRNPVLFSAEYFSFADPGFKYPTMDQ